MRNDFFKYLLLDGSSATYKTELESETLPFVFKSDGHRLRNYRIYGAEGGVGDLDSDTGKYTITVKNEGKNLFGGQLVDGYELDSDGLPSQKNTRCATLVPFVIPADSYIVLSFTADSTIKALISTFDGDTKITRVGGKVSGSTFQTGEATSMYLCFYKTDSSVCTASEVSNIQVEVGTTATTFEPYFSPCIADIVLDNPLDDGEYLDFREQKCFRSDDTIEIVPMPAVTTANGKNTLSVVSTVQPAKVYVQGNIQEIPVSLQMSPLNLQSLQTMVDDSIDDSFDDVMPIQNPNSQLNNSVGGVESAE